jgi:hypothetical protein
VNIEVKGKKWAKSMQPATQKPKKIALDCIYALALFVLLWSSFALVTLTLSLVSETQIFITLVIFF